MKKVINDLESKMLINEDDTSSVLADMTGLNQAEIDEMLPKMGFSDFVELTNTITTDDPQRATDIINGYIDNADPDAVQETTGISSSTIGTTGTKGTTSTTTTSQNNAAVKTNSPTTKSVAEPTLTQQNKDKQSQGQTQTTTQSKDLKVGDELDMTTHDGKEVKGKISSPNGPNNTVTVNVNGKTQQISKDVIDGEVNEELSRIAKLAGLEEMTSAGSIGGMAMPMGEPLKRIPGTNMPKKKKNATEDALIGGKISDTNKRYGPTHGPDFTAGAGMPNDNYPPKRKKKK